jgi:hypothetical protein
LAPVPPVAKSAPPLPSTDDAGELESAPRLVSRPPPPPDDAVMEIDDSMVFVDDADVTPEPEAAAASPLEATPKEPENVKPMTADADMLALRTGALVSAKAMLWFFAYVTLSLFTFGGTICRVSLGWARDHWRGRLRSEWSRARLRARGGPST